MKWIVFLFLILSWAGCAPTLVDYETIRRSSALINYSDQIQREEAAVIAQNYIMTHGLEDRLYGLKPMHIQPKMLVRKNHSETIDFVTPPTDSFEGKLEKFWRVLFRDREGSLLWGVITFKKMYVDVDMVSGEVLSWGME